MDGYWHLPKGHHTVYHSSRLFFLSATSHKSSPSARAQSEQILMLACWSPRVQYRATREIGVPYFGGPILLVSTEINSWMIVMIYNMASTHLVGTFDTTDDVIVLSSNFVLRYFFLLFGNLCLEIKERACTHPFGFRLILWCHSWAWGVFGSVVFSLELEFGALI